MAATATRTSRMLQAVWARRPDEQHVQIGDGGWRYVPGGPGAEAYGDQIEDSEHFSDALMEMVDWALDRFPTHLGYTGGDDYEAYGDFSIALVKQLLDALDRDHGPELPIRGEGNRSCWPRWRETIELAPMVHIAISYFEWEVRR